MSSNGDIIAVKYEKVYLKSYENIAEAREAIEIFITMSVFTKV